MCLIVSYLDEISHLKVGLFGRGLFEEMVGFRCLIFPPKWGRLEGYYIFGGGELVGL